MGFSMPNAHIVKQIVRGTTALVDAYTGPAGELVMDTTTKELVLQDGITQGGIRIGSVADATTTSKGIMQVGTNLTVASGVVSARPFAIYAESSSTVNPSSLPEGCIVETDEPIPGSSSNVVDLTSAQTISGVKTFSSSPIVPTPTVNGAAVPKEYVDDMLDCGILE